MKGKLRRIVCVIVCLCVMLTTLTVAALTESEKNQLNTDIANLKQQAQSIQAEINKLKEEKSDQAAILAAINKQIQNTEAQITRCNTEINSINSAIATNKETIAQKEAEIAADKLAFKKRLSSIYMSNSGNTIQILLGAEDFSDFLRLSQFTASMTARDKKLIEKLKAEIIVINGVIAENESLLQDQMAIKETIKEKQGELAAQQKEASAIYNQISNEQASQQQELNDVNAEVKKLQKVLEDEIAKQAQKDKEKNSFINKNSGFQWPVNGFFTISAPYKSNDAVHRGKHNGIDIAGGGIASQPIRAIADGYVTLVHNGCKHNYKKSGNCCGNGYGNYCTINHGELTINGSKDNYVAYYAHASQIIVSNGQYVKQGQVIGYVGTTGWSTGYHLHLGLLKNGGWINPYPLFF